MIEKTVALDENSCRRALTIGRYYGGNTLQGSVIVCIQALYDRLQKTDPEFVEMLKKAETEATGND